MKTMLYGVWYGFDMNFVDSKNENEARLIRFDLIMISINALVLFLSYEINIVMKLLL
jgi:hypothetical protein